MIQIDLTGVETFLEGASLDYSAVSLAHQSLAEGSCRGNDFTGWMNLPQTIEETELQRIMACAKRIQENSQVLVVVGIGGSYLGARAAYELLGRTDKDVELLFAGNGLSADALYDTIERLGERDFSVNVVSKSGTTLEPALGFRVFRELLVKKYGKEEANRRIYATTDAHKGALKSSALENGWESFVVSDDVGGRYSVLSAVGLLPMAAAGYDVAMVLSAAKNAFATMDERSSANPAWQYATVRQTLRSKGKGVELLTCYEPSFRMMAEWWKQLFGESEGKEGMGIFPASVEYSADLHSMGQYVQEGPRHMFETVVRFAQSKHRYAVPFDESNTDGLNYLAHHDYNEICAIATQAVKEAHIAGGVPVIGITAPGRWEEGFGELVAFFELSCALSGLMQGVNPFDQPGVEAYKKNMFRMLGAWKETES